MNYYYEENTWGERFIPSLNRNTFQTTSAAGYFENGIDFDPLQPDKLTIIVGSDSGLLFKYLYKQAIPTSSRIAIIEPDDVFEVVEKECSQWLSIHASLVDNPAVSLHSAENLQAELFNGDDLAYHFAGKIDQTQASCAIYDYQNIYYPLYRKIRETLAARAHTVHSTYSIKTFTEQQMNNCVDNHTPMKARPEFGIGKVTVILGGGPSLDNHLDWVVQNRSKLFVISVSRISDKLQKMDLTPDLVVSVDPQLINYSAGKSGTLWEHVPLVSSYHVSHQLLKEWRGPHYFMGYRYPWETTRQEPTDTVESSGPTVGHAAIVLASRLGFSTILLAGIDLCLNASGDSHAQGTPEAELLKLPGNYDAQIATYAGNQAGISLGFYRSIDSLEAIGSAFNMNRDTVFNLSIHAAAISSIDYIDSSEVKLPEFKPEFDASDYAPLTKSQLEALRQEIIEYKRDFGNVKTICSKAKGCIDQIYGKNGKPPNPRYHERLDALEGRLDKNAPYAIDAIRHFMGPEYAQLRKPSGFAEMAQDDMERWARDYYRVTHRGAKYFQQRLERALEIIELRIAEQAETPDIEYLLENWTVHGTSGRVNMFHESLLPFATDNQKIRLDAAATAYRQSIFEKDEQRVVKIVSHHGSISKTMQSLRYLRENQCVTDLQNYSDKLIDLEWPFGTIAKFIQGIIAEVNSDTNVAVAMYQQVVDECGEQLNTGGETLESMSKLIEESLTNLTRLYLDRQDGASAASTLGVLSEITPQYIPSYANLLNMLGNYESAVELMNLYLDNFGQDFSAARQLAKMHEKAGNMEAYSKAVQLSEDIRSASTVAAKAA